MDLKILRLTGSLGHCAALCRVLRWKFYASDGICVLEK